MTATKRIRAAVLSLLLALSMAVPLSAMHADEALAYTQVESIVTYGHGYNDAGYLVVHETANPGASAANHVSYWSGYPDYAVHYVMELDGSTVYHTMPDWALAWHVGNGNYQTVGIELAHATNWADFSSQWDEAVKWCGDYLIQRGWGVDRMLSHNECRWIWGGTDHTDPTGYFADYGRSWDEFEAAVASYMGGSWQPSAGGSGGAYQPSAAAPDVTYAASTDPSGQSWLPEMVDRTDTGGSADTYAGNGQPIRWLAIDIPGWYQVCTVANGWLDPVYTYNKGDLMYGCAGDGSPITAVRVYYETPDPASTGWLVAEYATANVGEGFLSTMRDLQDTSGWGDDYAGNGGYVSAFWLDLAAA